MASRQGGSRHKSKRSRSKVKHRTPSFASTKEHKQGQGAEAESRDINSHIATDEIQSQFPSIVHVTSEILSTEASDIDEQPKEVTNCRIEEKRHINLSISSSAKRKTNDAAGVVNASEVTEAEVISKMFLYFPVSAA